MMRYDYETPIWGVIVICAGAFVIGCLFVLAFLNWDSFGQDDPEFIKWILLIVGVAFLVAALKPGNWRRWRYFYADNDGIHFPSQCPETSDTEWLLVPWSRVGSIKKEIFLGRFKGPAIELKLSNDEIDRFFQDVKLSKMLLRTKTSESDFFKVGYSNSFKNADIAVKILNEIKNTNT